MLFLVGFTKSRGVVALIIVYIYFCQLQYSAALLAIIVLEIVLIVFILHDPSKVSNNNNSNIININEIYSRCIFQIFKTLEKFNISEFS